MKLLLLLALVVAGQASAATPTNSPTISATQTITQTPTASPTLTMTPTKTVTPYRSASFHSAGKVLVVPVNLAVTNTSGTTTTSINYWISLPSWITLDASSYSANVSQAAGVLYVNIPTLAAGGNTLVSYSLDVALGPFDMGVQQSINGVVQNSDKNLTQSTTPKWAQATIP